MKTKNRTGAGAAAIASSARRPVVRPRYNSMSTTGAGYETYSTQGTVHLARLFRRRVDSSANANTATLYAPLIDASCPPTRPIRGIDRWDFDIFAHHRQCPSHLLCRLADRLFEQHGLYTRLRLNRTVMWNTFAAIESTYWAHNPYHTALHAADVTQALHCFIRQPKLHRLLSPVEVLACLLAAMCHDADHPGVNQSFLQRTGHFLVQLYNADSVLEQHHARVGISIMHRTGLARSLSAQTWHSVRDLVTTLVRATDITYQEVYRAKLSALTQTSKSSLAPYIYTQQDRLLLLQVSLKCADISNPCRPWCVCRQWACKVCEEFFFQGDQEERRWSLKPLKFVDRKQSSITSIQIGFLDTLVRPMFMQWHDFFRTGLSEQVLRHLERNYASWCTPEIIGKHHSLKCGDSLSPLSIELPAKNAERIALRINPVLNTAEMKHCESPVTFELYQGTQSDCSGLSVLVATRGLGKRRFSLPETQGAIRQTFLLDWSRKPPRAQCCYLRTPSASMLQTLLELMQDHTLTLINMEPRRKSVPLIDQ